MLRSSSRAESKDFVYKDSVIESEFFFFIIGSTTESSVEAIVWLHERILGYSRYTMVGTAKIRGFSLELKVHKVYGIRVFCEKQRYG